MSSHEKLAAAANDRKTRLAQLKSLKRKQAPTDDEPSASGQEPSTSTSIALTSTSTSASLITTSESDVTKAYLSGRNYDPETRNVKLGFETAPIGDVTSTLEYKAGQLALDTKQAQDEEQKEDRPLDLFKLQPKKPNWDLKRDLEIKLKPVNVWTENAIARIVRERVEDQKKTRAVSDGKKDGEGEEVGMKGEELVEAMHLKERDEEIARKREDEEEDGS